jgi:serine/threonine protein kinase
MIIDGEADFRTLLMHHLTTHWPDAIVSLYDPTEAGHLPDQFSGAGNDIVLLGDVLGDRDGLDVLKRFVNRSGFPPVAYFSRSKERARAKEIGADCFFSRDSIEHDALIVRIGEVLASRRKGSSTGSLFFGDAAIGVSPLIRGYRLIRKLGSSRHSAVYLAQRESDDLKVVLKVLQQVPDVSDALGAFDRFLQEYEMIAEIEHPNIVKIYDLGVGDNHAHIAMEYLEGGDLKERIAVGVTESEAVEFLREIASALAKTHEVGILHRDLKPGNIMLRQDDTIALIDFGLAKRMRLKLEMTDSGEIFGTPYYMSPEQGHGSNADQRSDIYSLGVIFYEMLTGEKPFVSDTAMGIIIRHAQAPVPLLSPRFSKYQALLNMMLAKDPQDRLQDAAEVGEWL